MVFIEGGLFQMGSSSGDKNELPAHRVFVKSFYIGKYEIARYQWKLIMGVGFMLCDSCPVANVSWYDVQKFIEKLNRLTSKRYRLPTEAEWEYAARGGRKSKGYLYSGSNKLDNVGWYDGNSNSRSSHFVGRKLPNELGLYDMSGNVFEWCYDWYDEHYYSTGDSDNPSGPVTGDKKVARGGCYGISAYNCRTARRVGLSPEFKNESFGFRLVLQQ